ncbi:unnamed protein product [Gongylonema pulchrum]|uniref:Uncharacterized protein n=1 Tax=Gongylonema pulchrum TaxID=637853 RepID=A0A3P7Q7B5_9BILA|nr:unnamed protein product [Gongylonema pulchrum]
MKERACAKAQETPKQTSVEAESIKKAVASKQTDLASKGEKAESSKVGPVPEVNTSKDPVIGKKENTDRNAESNTKKSDGLPDSVPTGYVRDPRNYSRMEDLSPEDLAQFKADRFEFGKVPRVPPPMELC